MGGVHAQLRSELHLVQDGREAGGCWLHARGGTVWTTDSVAYHTDLCSLGYHGDHTRLLDTMVTMHAYQTRAE